MEYLVVGPAIVNDIVYEDGRKMEQVLGGSVYCLAGLKPWTDRCLFVTNVGRDFSEYFGSWMACNQLSLDGLSYVLPRTWYTTLHYGQAGLHSERSIYDDDTDALQSLNDVVTATGVAAVCGADTKGIYIEASETAPIWADLDKIRRVCQAKIMWEIPSSATLDPLRKATVLETLALTDIFSINLPEALSLFSLDSESAVLARLLSLQKPCFFRVGQRGSYMINDGQAAFAPSLTLGPVIDPTGCGNASTAAALYGYCEGYTAQKTARMANISAAFNLLQYGPYPQFDEGLRSWAAELLEM